jgi:hypothetical protein
LEIDVWEKAEGWEFGSFAVISLHSCMSWRIDDQLPMKKPDALFQLISSLSRGEKRNFRMLAQLTSGDKKYLQIFDIVDLMEEYDEAKVIRKFRNDPGFERQFAYIKNYLYNSILSSLVYFRRVPGRGALFVAATSEDFAGKKPSHARQKAAEEGKGKGE